MTNAHRHDWRRRKTVQIVDRIFAQADKNDHPDRPLHNASSAHPTRMVKIFK
jgi:hypothetical protein